MTRIKAKQPVGLKEKLENYGISFHSDEWYCNNNLAVVRYLFDSCTGSLSPTGC